MNENRKGFTLTELLAVIVILGILLTIAIPSATGINRMIKNRMYKSKIDFIEKAAQLYGQDNADFILDDDITVGTLKEKGYIKADNDDDQVVDPRNNRDMKCDIINIKVINTPSGVKITASAKEVNKEDPEFNVMYPNCDEQIN